MFPTSNFDVFSRNPAVFRQKRLEGLETAKLDKKKHPADGKLRGAGVSKKWRCRRHCCHSIVAGTTAVVPARFVSHLRVANRLRRLCPLGDGELFKFYLKSSVCQRQTGLPKGNPPCAFPAVPVGVLGAEPLSLMPQHSSREPAKRCSRARAVDQGFFDSLTPRRWKTAGREAYSFSRRALPSRTSLFSSSMKLETSVNWRYTDAKRT